MNLFYVLLIWAIFNIYTFILMGMDKQKAKKGKRRTPEAVFFQYALWGGSLGVVLGMFVWRHKTKKASFKWRVYGSLAFHVLIVVFLLRYIQRFTYFELPF